MTQFSMADAIAVCMASVANRKKSGGASYVLFYSNQSNNPRYEGKMKGPTVKFLIDEFRQHGGAFRFAIIFNENDLSKPVRYFDRALSKKFFAPLRTKKRKV